ncbi:MAG: hypothetical protein AAF938_21300 [Myxococcota bacterium]
MRAKSSFTSSAPEGGANASESAGAIEQRAAEPIYRVWTLGWSLAIAAHLALPDARQDGWLIPNIALGGATLLLVVRRRHEALDRALWLVACGGLVAPLLFFADALSQSVYLAFGAASAALLPSATHLQSVRGLTAAMYGAAFFHKLNADFLNGAVSCATGGITLFGENYGVDLSALTGGSLANVWPVLFLSAEASVALLLLRRPMAGIALAALLHVPLTIIFAPAFAWVMASGWTAFFSAELLQELRAFVAHRGRLLALVGAGFGVTSAALYFRVHESAYPAWQLGEFGWWIVAAVVGSFAFTKRRYRPPASRMRPVSRLIVALFVLNAATPYTGLQFHHAGAMLSNLRIDEGCWNHLLVPEAVRIREPYVRVEEASLTGDVDDFDARVRSDSGERASLEIADLTPFETRLFDPAGLHAAVAERCERLARFAARGAPALGLGLSFNAGSGAVNVPNACEDLPLDPGQPGAFQTNLQRSCPQACVH